jgi:two-component sensor histidine kinase
VINVWKHAYAPDQAGGSQVIMTTGPGSTLALLIRDQGSGRSSNARSNGLGDRLLDA